ncbi:MAG: transglycosylase SLT domain-containing protein [Gammaproteobacteria bacterium]
MRKLLFGALATILATAPAATAQDMQPTWYTIFADHVAISDQAAYEEAGRDFARLFNERGAKDVAWVTITGAELGFTYAMPGYGPADMARMNAAWGAAMTAVGDEASRISAKSDALVESREMYYLLLRPDLSYNPEGVAFKADEPYRHYVQFRVHPTKTADFEASANAWAKAYGDHGIETGFRVYEYITGDDLPMYLLVENARDEAGQERFRSLIGLFRKYGEKYGLDPLLLVAQGYQESELDHSRKSSAGAVGIMQMLPSTARDKNVGIADITGLENNIEAAAKYLSWIMDRYFNDPDMPRLQRELFALAAYNAGPARVARLRREAEQQGLDPDEWFNNVEIIAARRIGRETVQYVANIYKYYLAYEVLARQVREQNRARERALGG